MWGNEGTKSLRETIKSVGGNRETKGVGGERGAKWIKNVGGKRETIKSVGGRGKRCEGGRGEQK